MNIARLPAWRNVEAAIIDGRYTYGDLIPYGDFYALLGLPRPSANALADEAESWRLAVLAERTALVAHMLKEHRMMLDTETGTGLRILLPCEQTAAAELTLRKDMTRALRTHRDRILHVDHAQLTAEQRQENANAQVRFAKRVDALRSIEHSRLINAPKSKGALQ